MGGSAMIISSEILTTDEFQGFIRSVGGSIKYGKSPRGGVSEGESDIWLAMLSKDVFENFYDAEDMLEWQSVLGAVPKTIIEIGLDYTQKSRLMCLEVILGFGKLWNCVLHDVDDSVLSYNMVSERYNKLVSRF